MFDIFDSLRLLGEALGWIGNGLRDFFRGLPALITWFQNLFSSGAVPPCC